MFARFDTIHERDGQTLDDGICTQQTDGSQLLMPLGQIHT